MPSITQTPLPNLLHLPFSKVPTDDALSLAWIGPGDVSHWFSRSAWSITVVALWRQRTTGNKTVTIWVPDFFCNESLALLRKMSVRLVFYPVNECGHPDAEMFPAVTKDNWPDLFLLVHYFGEQTPCDMAAAFCKAHGAWMVEDAAHVLMPIPGVGEAGDCVLYSPHKHLSIPDGAILVVRKDGPSALGAEIGGLKLLDEVVRDTLRDGDEFYRPIMVWLVKRFLQRLGIRIQKKIPAFANVVQAVSRVEDPPGMSSVAKRLLGRELFSLSKYAEHRVNCAANWRHVIHGIFPAEVCKVIPARGFPYLACVSAVDQATAEYLYARFHEVGIPVSTWPDLPPEVTDGVDHAVANHLRHTRLYLPVHQSLSKEQIMVCGQRLRDASLSGWRLRKINSKKEWNSLWLGCQRKSLPQTWEYGSAKAMAEGWLVQRFVVLDDNNLPTALFQVLVKGLPGLGGVARVNRGPLMLRGEIDSFNHLSLNATAVLIRESRRRRWWMLQIAPLLPPSAEIDCALRGMGLRRLSICPMDSALLSLKGSDEKMIMGFKGKWRNSLRKGQKLGVTVKLDKGGQENFKCLIDFYQAQQREKGFDGTSDLMLQALAANQSQSFKFNLYIALDNASDNQNSVLGVLVTLQFGNVSEYLIGVSNERGRANQANSVLLWEAILDAKRNGCRWFDVGGLADNTPKGIASFKKGLNPESYALVGEWRRWF